jgi:hypothetical protein
MPSKFALKQKLLNKMPVTIKKDNTVEEKKINTKNISKNNEEDLNPVLKLPIKPLKYKL